jgi:hypothetical protein
MLNESVLGELFCSEDGVLDGISNLIADLILNSITGNSKETSLVFFFDSKGSFFPVIASLADNRLFVRLQRF